MQHKNYEMIDFTPLDKEIEEKSHRPIDTEKPPLFVIGPNRCVSTPKR